MVKNLHDLEIELAELKGFNRALAMLNIVAWIVIPIVIGIMFYQISLIPSKDASALQSILDNYHVITI